MRGYELMYILDPTLDEEATQALMGQVEEFMTKQGVQIEKTDPWGKRRLAYHIGKHWEGYYVLNQIQAEAQSVAEVERRLRVTDGVLRFLTVRVDEEQAQIERQRVRKTSKESARRQRRGEPKAATLPAEAAVENPETTSSEAATPDAESPSEEPSRTTSSEAQDSASTNSAVTAEETS